MMPRTRGACSWGAPVGRPVRPAGPPDRRFCDGCGGALGNRAAAIASEANESATSLEEWNLGRNWHGLTSPEFVERVEAAMVELEADTVERYPVGPGRGARATSDVAEEAH